MGPIIEISNLSYTYPDGARALSDVSLSVQPGEKIALVGANGAGKSTLLYHLNGVFRGQGQVRIAGLELTKPNLGRIRALVGLVFQDPDDQLFSPTVYEDVAYGPIYQGLSQDEAKMRVEQALQAVGMLEYRQRVPYHLSQGEKKRIAIAAVLSMQPQVLVFDEPTAGLDPRARRELIELLESLPQTLLVATHDLQMVSRLTRRTVIMGRGRIVADGETQTLLGDAELLLKHGLK